MTFISNLEPQVFLYLLSSISEGLTALGGWVCRSVVFKSFLISPKKMHFLIFIFCGICSGILGGNLDPQSYLCYLLRYQYKTVPLEYCILGFFRGRLSPRCFAGGKSNCRVLFPRITINYIFKEENTRLWYLLSQTG